MVYDFSHSGLQTNKITQPLLRLAQIRGIREFRIYKHTTNVQKRMSEADATALRRGGSRSLLQKRRKTLGDATALRRGGSRSRLQRGAKLLEMPRHQFELSSGQLNELFQRFPHQSYK